MDISLLDAHGADPMPAQFALLAGNTRAYQRKTGVSGPMLGMIQLALAVGYYPKL